MAEDPVFTLKKAREQVVRGRRHCATALAGGYQRGETESSMQYMVQIQQCIEALDRAIEDEQKNAPEDVNFSGQVFSSNNE